MGTRSLTIVKDNYYSFLGEGKDGENQTDPLKVKDIIVMYRQMDGYPSGMGADLFDFLDGMEICNGISLAEKRNKLANGMGCLAAQLVAHFKEGIGSIYLHPSGTRGCDEEWIYTIFLKDGQLNISVKEVYAKRNVFTGTIPEYGKWLKEQE